MDRYAYSPIASRKPFSLPSKARVAVWVGINVEYFDIGKNEFGGVSSFDVKPPNVFDYSVRDYGNRVGFWRVLELLDKYHMKASVLLNSEVCTHYREIVSSAKERAWEFLGHGMSNSSMLNGLDEDEERQIIRTTLSMIEETVGQKPRGWLSPGLQETFNTPDILAEEGVEYLCDWCCDDQPFLMNVRKGRLISVPYSLDLNDFAIFILHHMAPRNYYEIVKDHFDALYSEGTIRPGVMCLGLHPFVIGQPSRIKWLEKTIEHISRHRDVWLATAGEIASWYYDNSMESPAAE